MNGNLTFDQVLTRLKAGRRLRRKHWDEGVYLTMPSPDGIIVKEFTAESLSSITWDVTQRDILANNWECIDGD